MNKTNTSGNKCKADYKKPELVHLGDLLSVTKATSAGSVIDGGIQPNKNVRMR